MSPRSLARLALGICTMAAPLAAQPSALPPAVVSQGAGPETFVLLTGMVGGIAGYQRLERRLLARGYRVIVIDPYLLSLDSADVSFAAMARRVEAVLAARGVRAAHVVGHSHGAGVALRLAASAPGTVADLYLLDAGAEAANRGPLVSTALRLAPALARLPFGCAIIRKEFVRGLRQSAGRQDWLDLNTQRAYTEPMLARIDHVVAMAIRLSTQAEPEPLASVVARVHVPVTVILGAAPHTADAGPEELAALALFPSPVHVARLAGVGHFPHEEAPDMTASLLIARPVAVAQSHDRRAP